MYNEQSKTMTAAVGTASDGERQTTSTTSDSTRRRALNDDECKNNSCRATHRRRRRRQNVATLVAAAIRSLARSIGAARGDAEPIGGRQLRSNARKIATRLDDTSAGRCSLVSSPIVVVRRPPSLVVCPPASIGRRLPHSSSSTLDTTTIVCRCRIKNRPARRMDHVLSSRIAT